MIISILFTFRWMTLYLSTDSWYYFPIITMKEKHHAMNKISFKVHNTYKIQFIFFVSKKWKNDEPKDNISEHCSTCTHLSTIIKIVIFPQSKHIKLQPAELVLYSLIFFFLLFFSSDWGMGGGMMGLNPQQWQGHNKALSTNWTIHNSVPFSMDLWSIENPSNIKSIRSTQSESLLFFKVESTVDCT